MGFGGSSSGGSGSIASSTDVALNNVINNQLLGYDTTTSKWKNVSTNDALVVAIRSVTSSTTLILTDAMKAVEVTAASATTITIPPHASVAFPIGTVIEIVQLGTGSVSVAAGAGVTLQSAGNLLTTRSQFSAVSLRKRATNTWLLVGDVA